AENIERKLKAIREQAEKLAKEGKGEQAEKLMREAKAAARAYKEQLARQLDDRKQEIGQKVSAIRERAQKLAKEGKGEEAEKLRREAEAMVRSYKEQVGRPLDDRAEIRQKLTALGERAERLAKEGKGEDAEKLMREAEAIRRSYEE